MMIDTFNLKYRMQKEMEKDNYKNYRYSPDKISDPMLAYIEGQMSILILLEKLTGTKFTRLG